MSKELLSAKYKTCLMTANDRGKSFVETVVGATVILKGSKHDLSHNCCLCRSTGLFLKFGLTETQLYLFSFFSPLLFFKPTTRDGVKNKTKNYTDYVALLMRTELTAVLFQSRKHISAVIHGDNSIINDTQKISIVNLNLLAHVLYDMTDKMGQ